jgi:predicted nucleic acid-binding Zn ribbon protein
MRSICSQCGAEIPADSDFCYRCGELKSKSLRVDDAGYFVEDTCPHCGAKLQGNESFCGACGGPINQYNGELRPNLDKNSTIALLLALIPGFFNIFGLGHLFLKQWYRGIMFLVISGILWYIYPAYLPAPSLGVLILRIGVVMFQLLDLYRIIYTSKVSRWTGQRNTGPRP